LLADLVVAEVRLGEETALGVEREVLVEVVAEATAEAVHGLAEALKVDPGVEPSDLELVFVGLSLRARRGGGEKECCENGEEEFLTHSASKNFSDFLIRDFPEGLRLPQGFSRRPLRRRLALVVVRVVVAVPLLARAAVGGAHVANLVDDLAAQELGGEATVNGYALAGGDDTAGARVRDGEDVVERRLVYGEDEVCRPRVGDEHQVPFVQLAVLVQLVFEVRLVEVFGGRDVDSARVAHERSGAW